MMLVGTASADRNVLHTVVIKPAANVAGCPVTSATCTPKYVTVSSPADSWPASSAVLIAECNFGTPGDADPGLCDNRAGHFVLTHTEADGSLTTVYDAANNNLGPIKVPLVTGTIGSQSPFFPPTPSRPDAICPPPIAQRAVGRNCGIVVAQVVPGDPDPIKHISGAVEWFTGTLSGPTSGASDVDIALSGNHYGNLASTDKLACDSLGLPMTGSPASCFTHEAVRIFNGTRLIGAAIAGPHGEWTTNVHIPVRSSGSTYTITTKGVISGITNKLVYTVS